jgi:DNA gyrase subunit A
MATNIPPHNLGEVVTAIISVIEKPDITIKRIIKILPGPDFPTGGLIIGNAGIKQAYETGNGLIKLRARVSIESMKNGKESLIVNEIPYQVNKSRLIQSIAEHAKFKKLDGISDLRDESDKDGTRIVIELKRGVNSSVIMNQLFKMTSLEVTYGINLLALDNLKPVVMNIKQVIQSYIAHREEIVKRRTRFELEKAESRAHILKGFLKALDNIDKIIKIIRASKTPKDASESLVEQFSFTKVQADAILDMRLSRLTGLEMEKIKKEYDQLVKLIKELKELLKSRKNILEKIIKELKEISKKFADERRTTIIEEEKEVELRDLIIEEDVVVTISHNGFIKRTPITAFKHQSRGGVGVTTSSLKEDDFIENMFIASTHDTILFISNKGKAHSVEVHEIVNVGKNSKGQSVKLFLNLTEDEKIASYVRLSDSDKEQYILFLTKKGYIKKSSVNDFKNVRRSGIIAITLGKEDTVIDSVVTNGKEEILIATAMGNALRLKESTVRTMGRTARGVTAIKLRPGDYVCGITRVIDNSELLVVTENGFGKKVRFDNFSPHGRGTKGQIYIKENDKTGKVIGILAIKKKDGFVVITEKGMIIKLKAKGISVMGRTAGGIKIVNIKETDTAAAISRIIQD